MPNVPVAQRQVQPEGLPGVRVSDVASPVAFGAGLAEVGQRAGLAMIADERQKADDMAIMAATNDMKKYSTALLYDPKNGYLNKMGKDSFASSGEAMKLYDDRVAEVESGLGNERQKAEFRKHAFMLRGDADLAIQRHVSTQIRAYDAQTFNSFIDNSHAAIAGAVATGDFAKVGFEIASQNTETAKFAERNGLGAEWVKDAETKNTSRTHLMVVETLAASGNDQGAEAYFKKYQDQIVGQDNIHSLKLIDAASTAGASQRQTDRILQSGASRVEMYESARTIENPKIRDAVGARLDHEFARQDAQQRQVHEAATNTAINLIEGGTQFDNLPPNVMSTLSVGDRASLRAYSTSMARGDKITTDWGLWYSRVDEASDPKTRDRFLKRNLMTDRGSLADSQFTELVLLQKSMRGGQEKKDIDETELTGYRTNKQIVDDTLTSIGFDTTPKAGSKQSADVTRFRRTVDEQIVAFKEQHNRKPNFQEVEDIVDSLATKGIVTGTGFGGYFPVTKYAFQLTGDENFTLSLKEIPRRQVEAIQRELKRTGQPVTNDRIVSYYNTRLQMMLHNK